MISFQKANNQLYLDFKQELESLYINTFSKGISAQQISKQEAENYLQGLFEVGYGIFGFKDNKLVAILIVAPIDYDKSRPKKIKEKYSNNDTLYIAEVLVDENHRGQGLGKKLMQVFDEKLEKHIKHVLLRVWQENKKALALYKKSGFHICGEITQEKIRPVSQERFIMHKNYMAKAY